MGICLWYTLAYLISRSTASPVLMRAIPVRSGGRGRRGLSHRGYRLPDDPSRSVEGRQTRARAMSCTSLEPHTSQEDRLMIFSSARTAPSQHTSRRTSGARFPTNGDGVDGTANGLDAAKQGLHMSIDRGAHRGASAVEHQCLQRPQQRACCAKLGRTPQGSASPRTHARIGVTAFRVHVSIGSRRVCSTSILPVRVLVLVLRVCVLLPSFLRPLVAVRELSPRSRESHSHSLDARLSLFACALAYDLAFSTMRSHEHCHRARPTGDGGLGIHYSRKPSRRRPWPCRDRCQRTTSPSASGVMARVRPGAPRAQMLR